ncbi:MAG: MarR family winged helix-turn-helix transcriptional regulator [Ruminococcus sp.]
MKNTKHLCTNDYKEMDIDKRLILNLRDLGHIIRFLYEGKGSQKRILIILNESGGMTQRELTERLGIKPGSASEVIGKLESAGLIERTLSQTDRRTADIKLTKAGLKKSNQAVIQRKKRHKEMFSCLTDDEKETLLLLAEKVNNDWDNRYRNVNNCKADKKCAEDS